MYVRVCIIIYTATIYYYYAYQVYRQRDAARTTPFIRPGPDTQAHGNITHSPAAGSRFTHTDP